MHQHGLVSGHCWQHRVGGSYLELQQVVDSHPLGGEGSFRTDVEDYAVFSLNYPAVEIQLRLLLAEAK